jgi:hypothetical protein
MTYLYQSIHYKILSGSRWGRGSYTTSNTSSTSLDFYQQLLKMLRSQLSTGGSITAQERVEIDSTQLMRVNVPGTGDCGLFSVFAALDHTLERVDKDKEVYCRGKKWTAVGLRAELIKIILSYKDQPEDVQAIIRDAYRESGEYRSLSQAATGLEEQQQGTIRSLLIKYPLEQFINWLDAPDENPFFKAMSEELKDTILKKSNDRKEVTTVDDLKESLKEEARNSYNAHILGAAKKVNNPAQMGMSADDFQLLMINPATYGEKADEQILHDVLANPNSAQVTTWTSKIGGYIGESNSYYLNRLEMFLVAKTVKVNIKIASQKRSASGIPMGYATPENYQKTWDPSWPTIIIIYESSHFNCARPTDSLGSKS